MPEIDHLRRGVTVQCDGCQGRGSSDSDGFRKDELAAILSELSPASNPRRMTVVGLRLSISNVLGFNHAGERQFQKGEVEAIHDAVRERQREVRARV